MDAVDLAAHTSDVMQAVLGHLRADQHHLATPCEEFDVAALVTHAIDTQELFTAAAGGEVPARTSDLAGSFGPAAEAAVGAWRRRGLEGSILVGENELPAPVGPSVMAVDAYVHAWDLAVAIGAPFEPPAPVSEAMWRLVREFLSPGPRGGGPFADPVAVSDDAPLVDRIVAHTGRRPGRHAA